MKNQILVAIAAQSGAATLSQIVRDLRVSARVLKSSLDALIAIGAITTYSDDDYARDTGEPVRYRMRPEHDTLYCFRYDRADSVHW